MADWTPEEIAVTVEDYFSMLVQELRGEPYSKAEHRRQLHSKLNARSEGAVERKHQNISAVLTESGLPFIDGYKPLSNYQRDLEKTVIAYVEENTELQELLKGQFQERSLFGGFSSKFYSWEIISPFVALKKTDRSVFLHHGTAIPHEIRSFFQITEMQRGQRKRITLKYRNTRDITESCG